MQRRWPTLAVTGIGMAVVVAHHLVSGIGDAMPFAVAYRPAYADLISVAAVCALAASFAFARLAPLRAVAIGLGGAVGATFASLAAYLVYHARHLPPQVTDSFGDPVRVTAFHDQLAVPVFVAQGFAIAILATALITRPARRPRDPQRTLWS